MDKVLLPLWLLAGEGEGRVLLPNRIPARLSTRSAQQLPCLTAILHEVSLLTCALISPSCFLGPFS